MDRENATTTAETVVVQDDNRGIGVRQVFLFLAGVTLLVVLLRLLHYLLDLDAQRQPPAQAERPARPAAPRPQATRKQRARGEQRARGAQSVARAQSAPRKRPARKKVARRRQWAERMLLAAEVTAVLLFVGAGAAAWQTLGQLNDTYRSLQQVDARVLPTVMPAADPGRLVDTAAQRGSQDEGLWQSLSLLPAPALPTPIPTSTPQATLPAPTPVAAAALADSSGAGAVSAGLGWGTSVVMSAPGPAVEQARRIQIPAIEVDSFVYQDYGPDWLKLGVVQFGEKVSPGQPGNLVLAAHNDIYGEIFRDLDELQQGEEVTILSESRRFTYRVRETVVVEPTETWVTLPTSSSTLTLISCYPYLVGTQRIVVFADLAQ